MHYTDPECRCSRYQALIRSTSLSSESSRAGADELSRLCFVCHMYRVVLMGSVNRLFERTIQFQYITAESWVSPPHRYVLYCEVCLDMLFMLLVSLESPWCVRACSIVKITPQSILRKSWLRWLILCMLDILTGALCHLFIYCVRSHGPLLVSVNQTLLAFPSLHLQRASFSQGRNFHLPIGGIRRNTLKNLKYPLNAH